MNSSEFDRRLRFLLVLVAVSFSLLWVRLFNLQVIQGESLRVVAESNRTTILYERAPRGLILDRNGSILADSRPTFVVLFNPIGVKREILVDVTRRLSRILNIKEDELNAKLALALKHSALLRLMDRASRSIVFALAEQRPNLPGISVVTEMERRYPHGSLASHVLGYLGQVSESELEELQSEGYRQDWLVGKMGLEKMYDGILRGAYGGMRIEVNASGHSLKILGRKAPVAGLQIQTTLDLNIQQAAEDALKESGKPGAAVALDPRSGEILAFASSPPYDPNVFVYTRGEKIPGEPGPGDLLTQEDKPLLDRAIQGAYPPGSIFKIIDTAAALESGRARSLDTFYCPGYYWMGSQGSGRKFMCWRKHGHGKVDFYQAVTESCDVFFYHLGLQVGPDPIEAMARRFGLGSLSGLGFPGERAGLVPGRNMFKNTVRRWFDGDTLNMAIGQGTILMTPIQAAQMIAAVANRGILYRPRIVREIHQPTGELSARSQPEILERFNLSRETWDFLDKALTNVVNEGTGQSCKVAGIKVAGKTGTAQNPQGKDHGWFVAYAPADSPEIAVAVLVEHGVHGATSAAPIARKILIAALSKEIRETKETPGTSPQAVGD